MQQTPPSNTTLIGRNLQPGCWVGGKRENTRCQEHNISTLFSDFQIGLTAVTAYHNGCRRLCALKKAIQTKNAPKHFCSDANAGAPEGTRTPDLLIRSQTLYPAELPAHILLAFSPENVFYYSVRRPESQAFFSKNSKNSANGHLSRKSAACGAGFQLFAVV